MDNYIDIDFFTNERIQGYLNDDGFLIIRETLVHKSKKNPEVYNLENVARWAYYHYKRLKKNKIIFAEYWEGFIIKNLKAVNELYTILTTKYNIPIDSLYYMSCGLHVPETLEKFNNILKENSYLPMKLLTTNNFEWLYGHDIENYPYVYEDIDTSIKIKPKKFMSLHGVPRAGRLGIVALLLAKDLIKDGYVSLVTEHALECAKEYVTDSQLIEKFPKLHKLIHEQITENANLFPMTQTLGLDYASLILRNTTRDHLVLPEDVEMYNNSYFNVISETSHIAFTGNDTPHALMHDCFYFTEKTYRTMTCKHPFVLGHRPFALAALRKVGFKTFHPYIDESYDLIEDDEDRLIAMMEEVERLCSLTDEDWLEMLVKLKPIVDHNFNVLKNTKEFKIEGF